MHVKCGPRWILGDSGWDQTWHFQTKDHQRASTGEMVICSVMVSDFWHRKSPLLVKASFKQKGKNKLFTILFQIMPDWITFMVQEYFLVFNFYFYL